MRWVWAWLAVAALGTGCGLFDDQPITVDEMCASLCDCARFPSQEARCRPECVAAFQGFPLPAACMECLASLECIELANAERECQVECGLFSEPIERNP